LLLHHHIYFDWYALIYTLHTWCEVFFILCLLCNNFWRNKRLSGTSFRLRSTCLLVWQLFWY
jgi:hypothetical protein